MNNSFLGRLIDDTATFGIVCTLAGVIVGVLMSALFNMVTARMTHRHEEQQQIRDLAVQLAVEEMKREMSVEEFKVKLAKESGHGWVYNHPPLEAYIGRMLALAQAINASKKPSLGARLWKGFLYQMGRIEPPAGE